MIQKVQHNISNKILNHQDKVFLLAVSGGVDSMVLLSVFQKLNLRFYVAHCNFQLRDEESENETLFVKNYCINNKIDLFVKYFDTEDYAKVNKVSIQIAARELRYNWFYDLMSDYKIDYLVTAHHLNDQIETFFINSLRATSLNGLTGIPEFSDTIVRPLLEFSRQEILNFANANKIEWKEDSSNESTKYIRNKIRHKIVPVLEELSPDLYQNFKNLFLHLSEDLQLKEEYINELHIKYTEQKDGLVYVNWNQLKKESNAFLKLKQLVMKYGFDKEIEIRKIIESQPGKSIFSSEFELLKDRECFIIKRVCLKNEQSNSFFIDKDEAKGIITLIFENEILKNYSKRITEISVNEACLIPPITIRKPVAGDFFYPLGMNGKKKISKYLKDSKFSKFEKEEVYLLVNGDGEIIWVIGAQMDNRFKINEQTTKIIKICTQ